MITPDEYQQKAIITKGNILLIAGAGAGKTFTIIGKINYLINNNIYKEQEILVISFTNKSVEDLKTKIDKKIDIYTFHKLAMNILSDYNFNFSIASNNALEYITDEFFHSLSDLILIKEILKYYKEYDYNTFLNSIKYNNLKNIIIRYIRLFKTNDSSFINIKESFKYNSFITKLILIIFKLYDNELTSTSKYDFDDLIKEATKILNSFYKYKYIIIDEFQDTSLIRLNLILKLIKLNNAYLFAVGDDYQSIYHFSGCNINLFLNLNNYIPNLNILKLKYTYRNSQELINIASKFILQNNKQIHKELISNKKLDKPIKYIYYYNPKKALKKLLSKLLIKYNNILVLERNNNDINNYLSGDILNNEKIKVLTVHSSKGLEADVVIIINLINSPLGFPSQIKESNLLKKLNPTLDNYLFAEERRLFYVALTRTKNEVYLLTPFINASIFVKEIKKY